jgi:hypothetical protein
VSEDGGRSRRGGRVRRVVWCCPVPTACKTRPRPTGRMRAPSPAQPARGPDQPHLSVGDMTLMSSRAASTLGVRGHTHTPVSLGCRRSGGETGKRGFSMGSRKTGAAALGRMRQQRASASSDAPGGRRARPLRAHLDPAVGAEVPPGHVGADEIAPRGLAGVDQADEAAVVVWSSAAQGRDGAAVSPQQSSCSARGRSRWASHFPTPPCSHPSVPSGARTLPVELPRGARGRAVEAEQRVAAAAIGGAGPRVKALCADALGDHHGLVWGVEGGVDDQGKSVSGVRRVLPGERGWGEQRRAWGHSSAKAAAASSMRPGPAQKLTWLEHVAVRQHAERGRAVLQPPAGAMQVDTGRQLKRRAQDATRRPGRAAAVESDTQRARSAP